MVYIESLAQPTVFELAQAGDFQAITHWINTYLRPQGLWAWVENASSGCLEVQVELKQAREREQIVSSICHLLWQLDSPCFEGVRIKARTFNGELLWKQSVRLLTPTTRHYALRAWQKLSTVTFKSLRSLLLVGSAVTTLILGCWVSYYEAIAQAPPTPIYAQVLAPKRLDVIQTALEPVKVSKISEVKNPRDPNVTLVFGGNVTLTDNQSKLISPDDNWTFAKLDQYREADMAMINLENPLTNSSNPLSGQQKALKAPPESVNILKNGGIDLVTLANDHAMDYDKAGLVETMKTLKEKGIYSLGAGRNYREAKRPDIFEVKGQTIAYFAYNDRDLIPAGSGQAGVNALKKEEIAADIKAVRDQVDWVIINYHWGAELGEYPSQEQVNLAHFTIDQGADLIVGHHPHILQGAEVYKDKPIIYSLGNFIFGQSAKPDYDTAVLKVSLKRDRMKVELLPIEVKNHQASVVRGAKADEIRANFDKKSTIFDKPMQSAMTLPVKPRLIQNLPVQAQAPAPGQTHNLVSAPTEAPPTPTLSSPGPTPPDDYSFIKVRFIKEPFISLPTSGNVPLSTPSPSPTSSVKPEDRPISFKVLDQTNQIGIMPSNIATTKKFKSLALPKLANPS